MQNHCPDDKEDKPSGWNKSDFKNVEKNEENKSWLKESILSYGNSETDPKIANR